MRRALATVCVAVGALAALGAYHVAELRQAREEGREEIRRQDAALWAEARIAAAAAAARAEEVNRARVDAYEARLAAARSSADELRRDLAGVRVCIDTPSRRGALSTAAEPAGRADGAAGGDGILATVADDLAGLAAECERNTAQLIELQHWVAALKLQ